jgi:NADP-dependent 3-hydroxy acid dehydrogenase YdfG
MSMYELIIFDWMLKKIEDGICYDAWNRTRNILPMMRKQKSGIIVNISSGAVRFGYPGISAAQSLQLKV